MAVPAYPADAEPTGLGFERCTIARWRGYVTSSFVAVLEDGTPVAESTAFRARGQNIAPDAEAARSAFAELRAELERQGWDASTDEADPWYEARFTRPAAEPEPVVQAAAPPPLAPQLAPPQLVPPPPAPPRPAPPQVAPPVVTEPRIELPELPPAAKTPGGSSRPSRPIVVVSTLGIAAALALGAYLEFGPSGQHAAARPTTSVSVSPPKLSAPTPKAKPKPKPTARAPLPAPKAATVRVDISAPTQASWLEVRRGSATGRVLFSGELAPGRHLHLTGTRLWARFGAANNLAIRANGRPVKFIGTFDHVFVAPKK
jgi:hypothetical protein